MKKFVKNGVQFSTFIRDGERYLCTGDVDGTVKFAWAGEIADYVYVVGATSVVTSASTTSIEELYTMWLNQTSFNREVLGVVY